MPFNKNPSRRQASHGGCLPLFTNPYTLEQRRLLSELAESNPTFEEFVRRKTEILGAPATLIARNRSGRRFG